LAAGLRAVLITGPVASGKTVVAQEIVAIAEERRIAMAAIDLDWLAWVTGARASHEDVIRRNLAAMAANHASFGVPRLVLARALVSTAGLHAIEQALPGWRLAIVVLQAAGATLESRLRTRDVGRELEHNLGHLAVPFESPPAAHRVTNESRQLRDVAEEVLRVAGWTAEA
jgi:hypothetical protein